MRLVCIQNSSLLVYRKSQKVSASYCIPFQHSSGKNQPVGGFRPPPPPGLFRVKFDQVMFNSLVLTWERNFEVTFGIFSVLVFQISVLESYLDIYLF